MPTPIDPHDQALSRDVVAKATSELNNLLQVIADTSSAIAAISKGTKGAGEYLEMLRTSVDRAEKVTVDLAVQAGGAGEKRLLQPDIGPFVKAKQKADPTPRGETILLVDDEEMALNLMERTLLEAGFDVVSAQSGFQCLDIFRCCPHRFAIVLLDLTLPFMDGEETFRRLRQIRDDVPVVVCTGFVLHERLEHMMGSGLAGFLRKPIAADELVAMVRSTLASTKYLSDKLSPGGIPVAS